MYRIDRNNSIKNSTVYTPKPVASQIYDIIISSGIEIKSILDASLGKGILVEDFDCIKTGVDIDEQGKDKVDFFIHKKFENTTIDDYTVRPNLIICNPPFNGCEGRQLYPEVFLRHMVSLFGNKIPIVLFTPYGLRLNQKTTSTRWKWMRDTLEISSILSLPVNIFEDTLFHSEVIFFNINNIKPHYWLN